MDTQVTCLLGIRFGRVIHVIDGIVVRKIKQVPVVERVDPLAYHGGPGSVPETAITGVQSVNRPGRIVPGTLAVRPVDMF